MASAGATYEEVQEPRDGEETQPSRGDLCCEGNEDGDTGEDDVGVRHVRGGRGRGPDNAVENCGKRRGPENAVENCGKGTGPDSAVENCERERGPDRAVENCWREGARQRSRELLEGGCKAGSRKLLEVGTREQQSAVENRGREGKKNSAVENRGSGGDGDGDLVVGGDGW